MSESQIPMGDQSVLPIPMKSKLADGPLNAPQFSVPVQTNTGEVLSVTDPRANRAMVALMDMNALQGGAASHFGGPSAFAELMSALHGVMFSRAQKNKQKWYDAFHFINDAGHCENGLYAIKANYRMAGLSLESLKGFRSMDSALTGHGEAHLFPEGVLVSNGPLGSGLPQAQGLAIADGMLRRKRVTVCALSDGGAMEGEAREALAAIPGLARKGKVAPFVLIISDNKTKLSGRIETDSFSMEPTFQALESLGWHVMRLHDGHNLQACVSTLEEAIDQASLNPSVPVAVHARTVKGKGNKKAEASATGAHGFPLKSAKELLPFIEELYEGVPVPEEFIQWASELVEKEGKSSEKQTDQGYAATMLGKWPSEKVQVGVSSALKKCRAKGLPVVSVSADLQGSTGVADFQKAYPEASLDVGVAESNMISTAIGLSLSGYIPIVDTFSQFGATKGALPLTMANLSLGPVIAIFSHAGFQDAADGASHQALSYYAQLGSIPHVRVISLSCSEEAERLVSQAVESFAHDRKEGRVPPTTVFFLGRENFPKKYNDESQFELGKAQIVCRQLNGYKKSLTLVANGSLVIEAMLASDLLAKAGVGSIVVHASSINHPDLQTMAGALRETNGHLLTVEDHQMTGGMGAQLVHALMQEGVQLNVRSLAVMDRFGQSAYGAHQLYRLHGLDRSAIAEAGKRLLER